MGITRKIIIFIVYFVLLINSSNVLLHANNSNEPDDLTNALTISQKSSPTEITIDGSMDLLSQASSLGWDGDGSKLNPFIIEKYELEYIEISNTEELALVIQNNTFQDISDTYLNSPKINLDNVKNVILRQNTIFSPFYGISILSSDSFEIQHNIIKITNICGRCNSFGINIDSSSEEDDSTNVISQNYIDSYGTGIHLTDSNNRIHLTDSNNIIDGNLITYTGEQWGQSWGHGLYIPVHYNKTHRSIYHVL